MKLNKRERDFYNNIPNMAKIYVRDSKNGGHLQIVHWHIPGGDCTEIFEAFEGAEILSIAYYKN